MDKPFLMAGPKLLLTKFGILHRLEGCDSNLRENLAKKHIKVTTILCNDIVEEKKNVARLSYSNRRKREHIII